jgi:acyl-homoserine-lactone acylase
MTLRGWALRAVVAAMPLSLLVAASPSQAEPGDPTGGATERRSARYEATVTRTKHGIPHVVAKNWGSLGYGHGYATAETNLCNLADTVVTGRGQRSRWFGPNGRYEDQVTLSATNLQADALFTDIRNRKVVESLLADEKRGPGKQARAMVRGYVAGANQYIRDIGGRRGVQDPACRGAGYIRPDVTALDLWYGVYAANLLASTGVFVPQIVEATPPTDSLPLPPVDGDGFPEAPVDLPSPEELLKGLGKDPASPFGSNATAVGRDATTTGRGMLLGNPHFPWRGRYRFEQAHLTIPGTYDVAGASLIGSPVVNIGWNKRVAWSHTVSTAYRFTPYEYRSVGGGTTYLTDQGPKELERRVVRIEVRRPGGRLATVTEDLYRTPQGYVLDAVDVLMPWTPASFFAIRDANGEHLRTVDTFLEMGKARNVRDLLRRQDRAGGMPWVNTTAADRRGDVVYADHSVVPNVPDDLVQRCATPVGLVLFQVAGLPGLDGTRAESDCAWRTDADASRPGIFGPSNLPLARRRDWVANANDSYWLPHPEQRLEGFARIIGCEECERTVRTRMVYRYVMDRLAGSDGQARNRKVSPRTLRLFQHTNRVFAAELARENGDLQAVCEAADGGRACRVLRRWDGRSDIGSRGTHLFGEFWLRVPEQGLWQVPFDPADPIATPRDLNEANPQVVQAMREAIDSLESRGVPLRARWGSLQVAGDDGAPPIPIGGGKGELGNANVTDTRLPGANTKFFSPVSYGSSHIQAVAFRDRGRVDARTILSYGQATDTTSRFSADQTRLFSKGRWVDFPFTEREVRNARIDRQVLRGR